MEESSQSSSAEPRRQSARLAAVRLIHDFSHILNQSRSDRDSPMQQTTFDVSLAAKHEYLGSDLEELRGRTLHDEGAVVWLPILLELGIILVPGQTLPMTVFYPPTISMLRDVISKDKTFGIVCVRNRRKAIHHVGTTAEIYQYQEDSGLAGFKIKAKGRQRFRLLEQKRLMPGILLGKVLILPEVSLKPPLYEARMMSLDRYRKNSSFKSKNANVDAACTAWPRWLCDQYDPEELVDRVTSELHSLRLVSNTNVPTDALNLSYWVAQCLPFDEVHRVAMLGFNTAIERLQYALRLLAECSVVYCQGCGQQLASRRDIFSMSVEGPQGTYCNPGGHVHEILTIYQAEGMVLAQEKPSIEYSWFPGYGWTIASCSNCNRHTGWLFTAMSSDLAPAQFWGLSRRAVTMYHNESASEEPSPALQDFFDNVLSYS